MHVRISGAGGELARAQYFNPLHEFRGASVRDVQDNIARKWVNGADGLIRPEIAALARSYTDEAISGYADHGFHVNDLNDVFFLYERGARRTGQVMHATTYLRDTYSPFFSRSFAEAVFSVDARARRTGPFHYRLIEELAPKLLSVPFAEGSWKIRSPTVNYYRELALQIRQRLAARIPDRFQRARREPSQHFIVKDTMFERLQWLQRIRGELREMCLDDRNSAIWDFVDKDRFDAATVSPDDLSRYAKPLFLIATVYYYDSRGRHLATG